jgi:hypothetical protein
MSIAAWLEKNQRTTGDTFTYKGRNIVLNGKRFNCRECGNLNALQNMHLNGEIDLYQPVEAYSERWDHETTSPIIGTRKRNDLPPVYMQWKQDYRERYVQN